MRIRAILLSWAISAIFFALPASDNFPGISGDALSANWTCDSGVIQQGGGGTARSTSLIAYCHWNADVFANNQVGTVVGTVVSDSVAGVSARMSNTGGGQHYSCLAYVGGTYAAKYLAGVESVLQDFGGGFTNGNSLKIEVTTSGSDALVKCYKDTGSGYVQQGTTVTDTTSVIASGSIGIFSYKSNGAVGSFTGDNLGGGGGGGSPTGCFLLLGVGCDLHSH